MSIHRRPKQIPRWICDCGCSNIEDEDYCYDCDRDRNGEPRYKKEDVKWVEPCKEGEEP